MEATLLTNNTFINYLIFFINLIGCPKTIELSSISLLTNENAPITTLFPMLTPFVIKTFGEI